MSAPDDTLAAAGLEAYLAPRGLRHTWRSRIEGI
jgi:hypothetical protein